jgi:hypothetical protein
MPQFVSPACFVYFPDEEKTTKENLAEATAHMIDVIGDSQSYRLALEIVPQEAEALDATEMKDLLQNAIRDSATFEKSEFVPVSVDQRGRVLYQRREDVDAGSDGRASGECQ